MRPRSVRSVTQRHSVGFLLAAALLLGAPALHAAGNLARAALDDATAAAKQWKPDAILTSVSSNTVDIDGKGVAWFYSFYSLKANSYLAVTSKGRSIDTMQIGTGQTDSVPADFLDSDKAMAEAVKAGLKGDAMRMQLTRAQWVINSGDKKGDLSVWLNPRTGRLIKRQAVQ
jgi:hypothetical protein